MNKNQTRANAPTDFGGCELQGAGLNRRPFFSLTKWRYGSLSLVLTGVLALWPREYPVPRELPTREVPSNGAAWKSALTQRNHHHQMRQRSASPPSVDLLHQKIQLALEAARNEPDTKKREEFLRQSLLDIASADVPRAVALLENEKQTELSATLHFFLLRKWVQNDPTAAEDSIRRMPAGEVQKNALDVVASEWANRRSHQQSFLLRRWAENDPAAAGDYISQMPEGAERQEALKVVANKWARLSFSQALTWARGLPENDERQNALLIAASSVARTAPIDALTLAAELTANAERDDLITHAAGQWAANDGETAAEWAKQIGDAELRERVLASIAVGWCEKEPMAATMLAITTLEPGQQQDDAILGIVQRWVLKEPKAVIEWVSGFPEGQLRERAITFLPSALKPEAH